MTRRLRNGRVPAALVGLALLAGACGNDAADPGSAGGGGKLGGSITIDGSSTVAPLSEAIAEEYRAEQSGVQVTVGTSGTGGGFKKLCAGEIDIADASRAIKEEETAECEKAGIASTELRVGLDGLALVTSAKNEFLECLDTEQLQTIFKQGGATTWDQVDPSFPKEKVAIFAPGTDSGTYDFFVEEVLGKPGEDGSLAARTDYTASEDDNTLVQGVEGEEHSFGFFGFAYFKENAESLKAVKLKGEDGSCVEPSDATVEDGSYELSRPLFLYVTEKALGRAEVQSFLRFYLETTPELITEIGYAPAPAADYEEGLAKLEG